MITIYFNDKPLFLTDRITPGLEEYLHHEETVFIDDFDSHTIKAMIHEMESPKIHAGVFLHSDLNALFQAFRKKFSFVVAAGGFVVNPDQEVLLIFRKGKWDLPKGKLDEGESPEFCALREITEETGIGKLTLEVPLQPTYHTYHQDGKFWLKESHWFMVRTIDKGIFTPQVDEDITKCVWAPVSDLNTYAENTHKSILQVLKEGVKKLGEVKNI